MNRFKLINSLLITLLSVVFIQCTSEPIAGPEGPAGQDGTNGTNGQDGGNVCLTCHNTDYKILQPETYALSGHATGTSHLTHGSTGCAACHTDGGYINTVYSQTLTASSTFPEERIGCSTCHSGGHASAGVAISGKDAALRSVVAYKLNQRDANGNEVFIDYNGGTSNNCIHCHQPRRNATSALTPNTSGNISISSTFGTHYGNQSALLEGMFGAEIPGATAYPTKGTATHRTSSSCTKCHMGPKNGTTGNHTMSPNLNTCKTCHTGAGVVNYDINAGQTKIKNLMMELAEEIVRLRPTDFRIANYTGTKPFTAPNVFTDATYSPNQLTIMSGTLNYPATDDIKVRVAKAYFNWRYLYQDHSYGLHNPKYAEALLKNTIADLKLIP